MNHPPYVCRSHGGGQFTHQHLKGYILTDPDGFAIRQMAKVGLRLNETSLAFEKDHARAIQAHWLAAKSANPALFNGLIFMASDPVFRGNAMQATCHPTRFATLMYWRTQNDTQGAYNIFANTVLRARDGALVMGRMASHTSIAGKVCYPGGSLDQGDVRDGSVDASSAAMRECLEETGIGADTYVLKPGYIVCSSPRRIAISRVAEVPLDAASLRHRILDFMAQEAVPEFDDIIIVRSASDAARLIPDRYERDLATYLFQEDAP